MIRCFRFGTSYFKINLPLSFPILLIKYNSAVLLLFFSLKKKLKLNLSILPFSLVNPSACFVLRTSIFLILCLLPLLQLQIPSWRKRTKEEKKTEEKGKKKKDELSTVFDFFNVLFSLLLRETFTDDEKSYAYASQIEKERSLLFFRYFL